MKRSYTDIDWVIIHENGAVVIRGPISSERVFERLAHLFKTMNKPDQIPGIYMIKELRLVLLADALSAEEIDSLLLGE